MKTVHIIGAGIGGLTTALTLKQKGYEVVLYEGSEQIKPVGAGIVLANNAMQVMQKLGVADRLFSAGNRISCMQITDAQLNPLSVGDLTAFEKKYKVSNIGIHRGELQRILAEEVGYDNIRFSKRLSKIEKSDNGFVLFFEDGTSVPAEIVIGADGIKSVVRNQLFGQGIYRDAGQLCWRGVAEMELPAEYHHAPAEAWGRGKRFGFVRISERKVYWYALDNARNQPDPSKINLEDLFKEFHSVVLKIIKETPKDKIILTDIADLKPIEKWHDGNVCLLGDAAHATTPNLGQGACQAVEDAYVLGECLAKTGDCAAAFAEYNTLRLSKAHFIVNQSWQIGKLAQIENPLGIWLRNSILRLTPAFVNHKQMEKIFKI